MHKLGMKTMVTSLKNLWWVAFESGTDDELVHANPLAKSSGSSIKWVKRSTCKKNLIGRVTRTTNVNIAVIRFGGASSSTGGCVGDHNLIGRRVQHHIRFLVVIFLNYSPIYKHFTHKQHTSCGANGVLFTGLSSQMAAHRFKSCKLFAKKWAKENNLNHVAVNWRFLGIINKNFWRWNRNDNRKGCATKDMTNLWLFFE